MFVPKDTELISANNEFPLNSNVSTEATETCSSEPLKILVFPPKNKQFRFDQDTNKIEIEPVDATNNPTEEKLENGAGSCENSQQSTLTPLVEKCNLLCSTPTPGTNGSNEETTEKVLKIQQILKIEKTFSDSRLGKHCFLKGCKWSGDGLCLLVNSEDNMLRLFEITETVITNPSVEIDPVLQMKEGGTVYDYAWYPQMNSSNPVSCVFACTSQDSPIHLWDAYTGQLRATYQPINQYDEVTSAYSLAFSPDGSRLYSGFKKCLRIFDISYPGRISEERNLKPKGNSVFQSNIVSSISINPCMPLYALGSYDKSVGIYAEPDGELICILKGHSGGITQIMFSSNGNYLFSGGRKDNEILCWDIRNPGKIVFSTERKVETQQKIQFDLSPDQSYLMTGTTDGDVKLFNISNPSENILQPCETWKAHEDCVNGVQFHPSLQLFATASGQRHLPELRDDEDAQPIDLTIENSIKIWTFDPC